MARRRRRIRSRSNLRLYALVTIACGVMAVLAHFMFDAPAAVRSYAESEINSAMRSAVRDEVKAAAAEKTKGIR